MRLRRAMGDQQRAKWLLHVLCLFLLAFSYQKFPTNDADGESWIKKWDLPSLENGEIVFHLNLQRPPHVREIADEARLRQAIHEDIQRFNQITTSSLRIRLIEGSDKEATEGDWINTIEIYPPNTIYDGEEIGPKNGSRWSAASWARTIAKGEIVECDIVFNPEASFTLSNERSVQRKDFRTVLRHEVGHCLGLHHTPLLYADMTGSGAHWGRQFSHDEISGLSWLYPSASFFQFYGLISGKIIPPEGVPIDELHITAVDTGTNTVQSAGFAAYGFLEPNDFPEKVTDVGPFFHLPIPAGDYRISIERLGTKKNGLRRNKYLRALPSIVVETGKTTYLGPISLP